MHNTFNYPIECKGAVLSFKTVKINTKNEKQWISVADAVGAYDPFEQIDIIPELVTMYEKVSNGANKERQVANWVSTWGILKERSEYAYDLEDFWFEVEKLYHMWKLYQGIANRDIKHLKSVAKVVEINSDDEGLNSWAKKEGYTHIFSFFDDRYGEIDIIGFIREGRELREYQNAAIQYLAEVIKPYINQGILGDLNISRSETTDEDIYKITPYMQFNNLIDVLYMQFFILLSENTKKVCVICNTPFVPSRRDKKFCSTSCYNTGKSQRYRAKQKKII